MPPFWELEDLLAVGLERDAALQVMAARRAALTLVDAEEPDRRPAVGRAALKFRFAF